MSNVQRAVLVGTNPPMNGNQYSTQIALYHPDGSQLIGVKQQTALANTAASDVAGLVAAHNALLAKLRSAGILLP